MPDSDDIPQSYLVSNPEPLERDYRSNSERQSFEEHRDLQIELQNTELAATKALLASA